MKPKIELELGKLLYHKTPEDDFTGFDPEKDNIVYFATRPSAIRDYHEHLHTFEIVNTLGPVKEYGSYQGWGYTKSPDGKSYWISMPASLATENLSMRE